MFKVFLAWTLALSFSVAYCQDVKKEAKTAETKMEAFVSKTGVVIKFIDYNLDNLRLSYGDMAVTRIRKLSNGADSKFFYQIEKSGQYDNSTASIEYSDLLEVIKAIQTLKSDVDKDISSNPDYLENKFVTEDGFQIGYFVSKGKVNWYLKLERYGPKNTIFLKDGDNIDVAFNNAKLKIQELKK
ncbi:hypothetical protein [Chitinophaga qingshengii]|uniref:Uncharacterized protein n=1 Tax=Chitinophaga qingshengii TaxID=1569794 RepID=A0ABR7TK77_9BACT|nr:hypothetical protein [Chitinophaga qingshengii]MBC9930892.1 hypothetical protein [Chitinophaga qingshengii]